MTGKDILEILSKLDILSDKECSKVYYYFLSNKNKQSNEDFFRIMATLRPESYEIRRCFAESLMNLGRFRESAAEWKYIIEQMGKNDLNILARLFKCYQGMDSLDGMESVYKAMEKLSLEHAITITAKDVYLSCLNARYECSVNFGAGTEELPQEILDLEKRFCMKLKDVSSFSLPRKKEEVPYINIKYKNGVVTHLYPIIFGDDCQFNIKYLPHISSLVLHWNGNSYIGQISSKRIIGVLEGKNGYLFLDNDTNKSVAQFTGRLLMDNVVLQDWCNFLAKVGSVPGFILFVPPSKESVFPMYYPHVMSQRRPIDQLKEVVGKVELDRFFYPRELLSTDERNYSKTETHYTALGAKKCFEEMAARYFDIDARKFIQEKFTLETRDNVGDLGSKVAPMRSSDFMFLQNTYEEQYKVYDNEVDNTGKVELYRNSEQPLISRRVLIFGDSFSGFIKPFFYACFREVLICRTVGTIYMDVVERFRPDYVISEMTERFIIQAPKFLERADSKDKMLAYDEAIFD